MTNPEIKKLLRKGKILFANEKYKDALSCFSKALISDPNNQDVLIHLGYTNSALGNLDEAVECIEKVKETKEDLFDFWNDIGRSYQLLKEYKKAIYAFKNALENDPAEIQKELIEAIIEHLSLKANYNQ